MSDGKVRIPKRKFNALLSASSSFFVRFVFHVVVVIKYFNVSIDCCRLQWSRSMSPVRRLEPWVRVPFESWVSVCVYYVCVDLCVGAAMRLADPRPRRPTDCAQDQESEKAAKAQQKVL
jgi:hypothetical protein